MKCKFSSRHQLMIRFVIECNVNCEQQQSVSAYILQFVKSCILALLYAIEILSFIAKIENKLLGDKLLTRSDIASVIRSLGGCREDDRIMQKIYLKTLHSKLQLNFIAN